MAQAKYVPEELGKEVAAPAGYYLPLHEESLEHAGRRLLFVVGSACIEASCCGVGSWEYLRVEGYVIEDGLSAKREPGTSLVIETIEDLSEQTAIRRLLGQKYPRARIEFR
jgi:hypothetical protein